MGKISERVSDSVTISGLFMLVLGIWAFFAPAPFAEFVTFPYNRHLLHDVGAFQIGIGTTMLLALMWTDGVMVMLAGYVVGSGFRLVSQSSTGTSVATPTIRWC
jgi:hypothetical protein